ncbi:hypothetical protein [Paenibacillus polymyxa]|nr:hypothetical protein [Paenibacillus polymyxa]
MDNKWEQMKNAAKDAVTMTLDNKFNVIQTAKELNDKYTDKSPGKKDT